MFPIGFLNPFVLVALAALPLIWWLLRITPPRPRATLFPPTRLLAEIGRREETPAHSPWWLTALRLLAALAIIVALAGPVWQPAAGGRDAGSGPLWLVVDNGWTAAPDWAARMTSLAALLDEADRADRTVVLAATADGARQDLAPISAEEARQRLSTLRPRGHFPDRAAIIRGLAEATAGTEPGLVAFASDGFDHGDAAALAQLHRLAGDAPFTVYTPERPLPRALGVADNASEALTVPVLRADTEVGASGIVEARDGRNFVLASAPFSFKRGQDRAVARFLLPIELRNDIARLEIAGEASAGAVRLIDDRWRRRTVGLVAGEGQGTAQPLLSPLHYLTEALSPFADVRLPHTAASNEAIGELLDQRVSVIVLADIGTLLPETVDRLTRWIDGGGVLIRFAGPHLAAGGEGLIPVRLRTGGRVLGGSLTWEKPQPLASFNRKGPFADLTPPDDVSVTRQVLAEPAPDLEEKTWASLGDGTPLVTATTEGRGWLVLYHVTADTTWSNLPLSGIFVDMMRRTVALSSASGAAAATGDAAGGVLRPYRILDGYGRFGAPANTVEPIAVADFAATTVSARHPPGLYGVADAFRALNVTTSDTVLRPLDLAALPGAETATYSADGPISLRPAFLTAGLGLVLLDALAVLVLAGGLAGLLARSSAVVLLAGLAAGLVPPQAARAQTLGNPTPGVETVREVAKDGDASLDFSAALTPRLAYVRTGNAEIDRISREGLAGLSRELAERTALEPGDPVGLDIASDELAFYPLIYWPIDAAMDVPPAAAMARIEAYMKNGGTVLFDTRDQLSVPLGANDGVTPETLKLRQILAGIDIPPIEPVPLDHVLTKSFYLLQDFPGRWSGSPLWVEAVPPAEGPQTDRPVRQSDGVSPILITGNDFAGAWAIDAGGRFVYPTVPPDGYQREWSLRAGINIVMYMMTGNYKADQVHIPSLLQRLGQ